MFNKSTLVKIALNTLLGGVLVVVWLQFVDLGELKKSLSRVELTDTIPMAMFIILSLGIRALRLKFFLKPIKQISFRELFFLNGAAFLFNILIPIRAGELLKGVYLKTNYTLPFARSITWIFLDRFLDFLFVLIAGAMLLLIVPTNFNLTIIFVIIAVFLLGLTLTYLMVFRPQLAKSLFILLKPMLFLEIVKTKVGLLFNSFIESFVILRRSVPDLSLIFLLTALAYISDCFVWYYGFLALGSTQDFIRLFLAQLLSALTYLVPAAPGYVGSAEASGILVFSGILGVETNLASSTTVLNHIITIITALVFGIISINFLKIDIKTILRLKSTKV